MDPEKEKRFRFRARYEAEQAQAQEQAMLDEQLEGLFGETAPPPEDVDVSAGDYAKTAASVATAATTGTAGQIAGTVEGLVDAVRSGTFGTDEGAQDVQQAAMDRRQQLTYTPEGEGAQEALKQFGEVVEPLESLEAVAPMFAPNQIAATTRMATSGLPRATSRVSRNLSGEGTYKGEPAPVIPPSTPDAPGGIPQAAGRPNAGAAGVPISQQRAQQAADMPIPLVGERAPTRAQLSRDFDMQQTEAELAKLNEVGAPIRSRKAAQAEALNANLQDLEERFNPTLIEDRDIGRAAATAVEARKAAEWDRVQNAYKAAEEAGEMADEIKIGDTADLLVDTDRFGSVAGNANPILKEAKRTGVVDADGKPLPVTLRQAEDFRTYVNKVTDMGDRRQTMIRRRWLDSIDPAMEEGGGELYRKARKARSNWSDEFEDTDLTSRLIDDKRGTNARKMAYEDAFQKTMLSGSVDELNKLRATLLKSGDEGKQAWQDMKGRLGRHIYESSVGTGTDSAGNPVISPAKLERVVSNLDKSGKLTSVFGKRGAAEVRDMVDVVKYMLTNPSGSVNYSNTSSALLNTLQKALRSQEAPGAASLPMAVGRAVGDWKSNRKLRKSVDEALSPLDDETESILTRAVQAQNRR